MASINDITNCINCGGPLPARNQDSVRKCRFCGTEYQKDKRSVFRFLKVKSFRVNGLYPALILIGITLLIYIYGISFDDFSETTLVRITPIWFFPIVFGLYGYLAEFYMKRVVSGKGRTIAEAHSNWLGGFLRTHLLTGGILLILLLPFRFLKVNNSLLVAFTGSVLWGILLMIFFQWIFPAL